MPAIRHAVVRLARSAVAVSNILDRDGKNSRFFGLLMRNAIRNRMNPFQLSCIRGRSVLVCRVKSQRATLYSSCSLPSFSGLGPRLPYMVMSLVRRGYWSVFRQWSVCPSAPFWCPSFSLSLLTGFLVVPYRPILKRSRAAGSRAQSMRLWTATG